MTADGEKTFACILCSKRKIKCDKAKPVCSTCLRLKHECIYQAPGPPKKRRRLDTTTQRLEKYEALLSKHGLLDQVAIEQPTEESPSSTDLPTTLDGRMILQPESRRYIDNTLWGSYQAAQASHVDDEYLVGDVRTRAKSLFTAAVLGHPPSAYDVAQSHPSVEHIWQIWDIFTDRVDPILKIVHVPTTKLVVEKAAVDASTLSESEQCICFAIYFISISSLEEAECKTIFSVERRNLAARYIDALQHALFSADLLRTTNIQVLQSFVIFLMVIRGRFDANLFWIMTGVAIRIAQRIGIHRDGTHTGLPPFETELHRRLFWQLPSLDGFAGQFAGTGIALDSLRWDTKQALNINDSDIWPGITEVKERDSATDMIFFLAKSIFVEFYKDIIVDLQALDKFARDGDTKYQDAADRRIDVIEDVVESRLLRYCDPMEPLQYNTSLLARVAILAVRFRVRMPRAKLGLMTSEENQKQCELVTSVLKRLTASHTNPATRKYLWHTRSFMIWDLVIWFSNHLSMTPGQKEAWKFLGDFCDSHPDLIHPRQPIAFAIVKLIVKAWGHQSGIQEPPMIARYRTLIDSKTDDPATKHLDGLLNDMPEPPAIPEPDQDLDLASLDQQFDWTFWEQLINDPETMVSEPL